MKRLIGLSVVLSMVFAATSFAATAGNPPAWDVVDHDFGSGGGKIGGFTTAGWVVAFGNGWVDTLSANSTTLSDDGVGSNDRMSAHLNGVLGTLGDYTYEHRIRFGGNRNMQVNFSEGANQGFELRHGVNNNAGGAPGQVLVGTPAKIFERYDTPVVGTCSPTIDVCGETATKFPGVDLTNFNVFRLVKEGSNITLFLSGDGTDSTAHTSWPAGGGGNTIQFYGGGAAIPFDDVEIDYIRVANGAFTSIPEPATMALLGLGSLLLLRRRHRA